MSELEAKIEIDAEDFAEELSDEALDRAQGEAVWSGPAVCTWGCVVRS